MLEYVDLSQLLDIKTAPAPLSQRQVLYQVVMLIRHEQTNNKEYKTTIIDGEEIRRKKNKDKKVTLAHTQRHTLGRKIKELSCSIYCIGQLVSYITNKITG